MVLLEHEFEIKRKKVEKGDTHAKGEGSTKSAMRRGLEG